MQKLIKIGEGILLGSLVLLLFLVIFESHIHAPGWLMVVGRMHPLFLHFPIVLLLMSLVTFWLPAKEANGELFSVLRLAAALSAVITAIMGLLLSLQANESGSTLQWHKWGGIIIAVLGYVFYTFYKNLANKKITGRLFTIIATIVIVFTGHFGGDLAHGENYLLGSENEKNKHVAFEKALVFEDIIKPVLQTKCGNCHGAGSNKGGLSLLDSISIMRGGKTGPLFVSGDPAISLLLRRIHLPDDDKKHMPPKNKSQLSEEEIALLNSWIKLGAPFNSKVSSLPAKDSFRIMTASFLEPSSAINNPVYDFSAADEKKIKQLNNNYRVLEALGMGSPALSVSFYGKAVYSKTSLEELLQVKEQVVTLSLSRMPAKDDEMNIVKQFVNLEKLNLNYTDITSKGIEQLAGLKKLTEISLSRTAVTADAVDKIAQLPQIHLIVIWDTKIDTLQVAALKKKFAKVKIENGFVDDGKFVAELSPPIIKSPQGVFDTMRYINIKHPFRGVEIRYTLDGTVPDSASSFVYKDSFIIRANTTIKTRAFRKGWVGSQPVQSLYIKRMFKPDSVELVTRPDPKYNGPGSLLIDADLGDLNFGNGKSLGYMNNPAVINMYFNNKVTLNSVMVNIVKRLPQFLFLPTKLEVWGGMDKQHLSLLGRINNSIPPKDETGALIQQVISFSPSTVKCIRVVANPIQSLPAWHKGKGKKGWVFLNEVVFN